MSEPKGNFAFVSTSGEGEIGLVVFMRYGKTRPNEDRWVRVESYEMKTPKFMCVSQNKILFVLNNECVGPREVENVGAFSSVERGMLRSFQINPTSGQLTLLSLVQTGGTNPVHMCVTKAHDALIVAQKHSVVIFNLSIDGVIGLQTCLYVHPSHCPSRDLYQPIQVHLLPHPTDKTSVDQDLLILEQNLERIAVYRLENKEVVSELLCFFKRRQLHNAAISKVIVDEKGLVFAINYDSDIISVFDRKDKKSTPSCNLRIDPDSSDLTDDDSSSGSSPGPSGPPGLGGNFALDDSEKTPTPDNTGEQTNSSMLDVNVSSVGTPSLSQMEVFSLGSDPKSPLESAIPVPLARSAVEPEPKASGSKLEAEELESKMSESEFDKGEKSVPKRKKVIPEQRFFDRSGFNLETMGPAADQGVEAGPAEGMEPLAAVAEDQAVAVDEAVAAHQGVAMDQAAAVGHLAAAAMGQLAAVGQPGAVAMAQPAAVAQLAVVVQLAAAAHLAGVAVGQPAAAAVGHLEAAAAAQPEAVAVAQLLATENELYCDVAVNFKMNTIYVVKSPSVIEVYKMNTNNPIAIFHLRRELLPDNKRPKSLKLRGNKLFVCTNRDILVYKLFNRRVPIERKNYSIACNNAEQIVFYHESENSACNYL